MALVLGLIEGESVYVGDRKVTLVQIHTPVRYKVLVEGAMDSFHEITDRVRTEILPGVFLSAGVDASTEHAKLAFDAPRDKVILRERLYERRKHFGPHRA